MMLLKYIKIRSYEMGLVFRDHEFRGLLATGTHWLLDLLVHRPDLPLYDNTAKVGFGLWDYPYLTLLLEAGLLFGAMALYLSQPRPLTSRARYAMLAFGAAIVLMQASMLFTPPPPSDRAMAMTALLAYVAFAGIIAWLERSVGRAALWSE